MLKKHFTNRIKSVLEFNHIRVQKLLEMSQDTIVTFIISLIAATLFNKMSFDLNISEENSITFAKLLIELIFLIILLYYVRKIIMVVPFFFRYTKNYIPGRPSSDGEGLMGKVVTMAIVFGTILVKLKEKIKHISNLF